MSDPVPADRLLIVDGTNYLFRSFFAVRDLRTKGGVPTNAIFGLAGALVALREKFPDAAIAGVMDAPGPTFRHELYPAYKATRKETEPELIAQIEPAKRLVEALGITLYCVEGVEADDVIATCARSWLERQRQVVIASSDKDLMYLAGKGCKIINPRDNSLQGPAEVKARFGVSPAQMLDYLCLVGDSADNVPGVPGVGPKTAAKWLGSYRSLARLQERAGEIKGKAGERLRAAGAALALARQLIVLREDVALEPAPLELAPPTPDRAAIDAFCDAYEINPTLRGKMLAAKAPAASVGALAPEVVVGAELGAKAAQFLAGLERVGLHLETDGAHAPALELVGAGLYAGERHLYVPLAGNPPGRELLAALVARPELELCVFDAKPLRHALANAGIAVACRITDAALLAYCLPESRAGALEKVCRNFIDEPVAERGQYLGGAKNPATFAELAEPLQAKLASQWAQAAQALRLKAGRALMGDGMFIYRQVELPVTAVLVAMEQRGIALDTAALAALSAKFHARMDELATRIEAEAGVAINLDSPKQLGELLYERLGLRAGKKTRGGVPSTNRAELERLAAAGSSPVPQWVLDYRLYAKLVGTYTDALPKVVNPATGRLHTTFVQTGAITGRLASVEPNLQNIPSRTEEGQRIRRCFVAAPGSQLVSADYSQLELRILAHFSKDATLLAAYAAGEDIHRRTAALINDVAPEDVTAEMRRFAKTINFGLIYGMGAHGLATRLGIARAAAAELIEGYFARLPGVRGYLEAVKADATRDKRVRTFHKRSIAVGAAGPAGRADGMLRAAQNAPMQGTAADIVKLAMTAVHAELIRRGLASRILLQVHDELVLEVPAAELAAVAELLPATMGAVVELAVPLEVNVSSGANWDAAHAA